MTAIAGIIDFGAAPDATALCRDLVLAQRGYGGDSLEWGTAGDATFGRALHRRFVEDRYDRQPVSAGGGRWMAVGDLRIDNRVELAGALGMGREELRHLADSELLIRCWSHWGDETLGRLAGTYAIAVWDREQHRLVIARDPFGQCPLHLAQGNGWFAFASMPQALRLVPGVDGSPDLGSLGAFVADLPRRGRTSFFRGIERIEPGHAFRLAPGGTRYWRHWNPPAKRDAAGGDLVEAFRFHLDQAVESCLRGAQDTVAAHLSSGWDSAAVAATAAMQLAPSGRVIGFTAAPPIEFAGAVPAGRIADESARAALAAAGHANLHQRVIRDRSARPVDLLVDNDRLVGEPTGYVCNNSWWSSINRAASGEASILLTAEMGNHTLSVGGAMQLADLVRTGHPAAWLREARGLKAGGTLRWSGIFDQSFGPFVPFYARLRPLLARSGRRDDALALLAPAVRSLVARRLDRDFLAAPPRDSMAHRTAMLGEQDSGAFRKASLARWGLDERDPTTERRFVEFCLSLPREALLKDGVARPIARAALADRVPAAILDARTRGLQFADWFCHFARDEVADTIGGARAQDLLDRPSIDRLLAHWPRDGFDRPSVIRTYRMDLMRAVSAASFVESYAGRSVQENYRSIEESEPISGLEK